VTLAAGSPPPLRPGVTLYLVRHGETDWNREARYQGQRDIPLNDTGRMQARRNGQALAAHDLHLDTIDFVSSPLARAIETMRLVRLGLGLPSDGFAIEPCLKELHYGRWEGLLADELANTDPGGIAAKARDPFHWRPDGGESYADLQERISAWLATLTRDTIAVTHGGVSRVARGAVLGLEPDAIPFLDVPQDRILMLTSQDMRWF
jgi:broad specificity phosphatase PhoE